MIDWLGETAIGIAFTFSFFFFLKNCFSSLCSDLLLIVILVIVLVKPPPTGLQSYTQ